MLWLHRCVCIFLALLSACASTSFNGSGDRKSAPPPTPTAPPPTPFTPILPAPAPSDREGTEEFPLAAAQGKVDLIWVIDNSGSMAEEAAQVRTNFGNFLNTLKSRTDTQMTLISKAQGSKQSVGLTAAELNMGHKQIDIDVGSTNALAILAAAICPRGTTSVVSGSSRNTTVCNQSLTGSGDGFVETPGRLNEATGALSARLRPDAKRVFVVVTDDEAVGVDSNNFLNLVAPYLGNAKPTMFAFRGVTDRAGCEVSTEGKSYESLAGMTGGAVFDICEQDWSPNFNRLSEQVTLIANAAFTLKTPGITRILSVSVNGKELNPADYQIRGNSIELGGNATQGTNGGKILVRFLYR